jgi:hypothetical protein
MTFASRTSGSWRGSSIRPRLTELSLPPPEDFLWQYAAATPMAGILAGAGVEARNALERDVVAAWRDYEVDDGMQIRQRIVPIATALR